MNKNIIIFTFALLVMTGKSFLQAEESPEKLTISGFLKTVENDETLKNQKELNIYLDGAPQSTPYIDRVEVRGKTEDFDIEKQKYSLRFYPKGWGETKYTRLVNETLKNTGQTDYTLCYNTGLLRRYDLVLDYLENRALISVKKKLAVVYRDRITVLRKKLSGSVSADIGDLIEAEELLTALRLDLVKLENKKTGLLHQIGGFLNSGCVLSFNGKGLVTVEDIARYLEKNSAVGTENILLKAQKDKVDLALNKYRLEKAKNRDYLSYLQVSYDADEEDDYRKACSVEFGIKLPFINSDREDETRKKIAYMKERLKFRAEKKELSEKLLSLTRSIERLIDQHRLLIEERQRGNATNTYRKYLTMEGTDPLNILKVRETLLKSDIRRTRNSYEIRRKFISLLAASGKLSAKPITNYLSENMEVIQ